MAKKGSHQKPHTRTSKKGKKFSAGKGKLMGSIYFGIKQFMIYKFDELSERAKKRAIEDYKKHEAIEEYKRYGGRKHFTPEDTPERKIKHTLRAKNLQFYKSGKLYVKNK